MSSEHYDIIIVGGGIAGLVLAALLPKQLSIAVLETKPPILNWSDESLPDRVSAINHSSQYLFESINCWKPLLKEASPYHDMSVWDGSGGKIDFGCVDIGEPDLGHIIPNRMILKTLWKYLEAQEHIDLRVITPPQSISINISSVTLTTQAHVMTAKLLVGADGLNSWVRTQLGFELHSYDYKHCALVSTVQTEKSHAYTAYQAFSEDAILAFLPLNDVQLSSIVWSLPPERVAHLAALSDHDFANALETAFSSRLGTVKCTQNRSVFPLKMRHSKTYIKPRVALVGDAAHTIHPLAGQGVNVGLLDVVCLVNTIDEALAKHRDIGHFSSLRHYERFRKGENWKMIVAMEGFKRLFCTHSSILSQIRRIGVNAIHQHDFLKRHLMQQAM